MRTTTVTLLPTTTYGTPSGNYDGSSTDWPGTAQQAADYYGGFGALQTTAFYLNGFAGIINIEATLDSDSDSADWFTVYTVDASVDPITANWSQNITGKFTFIRATVESFSAGSITKVTLTY